MGSQKHSTARSRAIRTNLLYLLVAAVSSMLAVALSTWIGEERAVNKAIGQWLSGFVTVVVAILILDQIREGARTEEARRSAATLDEPVISATYLAALRFGEAWVANQGVPPDSDPQQVFENLEVSSQVTHPQVCAALDSLRTDVAERLRFMQDLRRQIVQRDGTEDADLAMLLLDASYQFRSVISFPAPRFRATVIAYAQAALTELALARSPETDGALRASIANVSRATIDFTVAHEYALLLEGNVRWGLPGQKGSEISLDEMLTRVISAFSRAAPPTGPDLQDLPNILGLWINVGRQLGALSHTLTTLVDELDRVQNLAEAS